MNSHQNSSQCLLEFIDLLEDNGSILLPQYEYALIGITSRECKAVYERNKIIEILMVDMDIDEAEDNFGYDIESAYFGDGTPEIVHTGYVPQQIPSGCLMIYAEELQ